MINQGNEQILSGGNMNAPKRVGNRVFRKKTKSTETIHQLLKHVRTKGIDWVPIPYAINRTHEELSYIAGEVPHEMPGWIWKENTLRQIARKIRNWHDATMDFTCPDAVWNFETGTAHEVICHNDFAPYNCVYTDETMTGLIDFDLCAPGSRLWDMAYTAYRYIPIMPREALQAGQEYSPFDTKETNRRIDCFLSEYANGALEVLFDTEDLLRMTVKRLDAVAAWTQTFAEETGNTHLMANSRMYRNHSHWIQKTLLSIGNSKSFEGRKSDERGRR